MCAVYTQIQQNKRQHLKWTVICTDYFLCLHHSPLGNTGGTLVNGLSIFKTYKSVLTMLMGRFLEMSVPMEMFGLVLTFCAIIHAMPFAFAEILYY